MHLSAVPDKTHMVERMRHEHLSTNGRHGPLTAPDQHLQQGLVRRDVTHDASQ